ncbi:hypothetical protein EDE04_5840 [Streptomyces sp. 2132.2]|nr:hypothetical protein EDE04_5840 [Streptomyces sp. 2132.2]
MQPLALNIANSIFLGDYLTSEGQAGQADLDMIADAGFEVEGAGTTTLPAHRADALAAARAATAQGPCGSSAAEAGCGSACGGCSGHEAVPARAAAEAPAPVPAGAPAQAPAGEVRSDLVAVRRRGAGTDLAPNA